MACLSSILQKVEIFFLTSSLLDDLLALLSNYFFLLLEHIDLCLDFFYRCLNDLHSFSQVLFLLSFLNDRAVFLRLARQKALTAVEAIWMCLSMSL